MPNPHQPHHLRLKLGRNDLSLDIDCPGPEVGWCQVFETSLSWPDSTACHCTVDKRECPPCNAGDHGGCVNFGRYFEGVDYECRCSPVEGCGIKEHALDWCTWEDMLHGPNVWDVSEYPVAVDVHWEDGSLVIFPWSKDAPA